MEDNREPHQQGDVLLRPISELPAGEQVIKERGCIVVAHGESGHTHLIEADESDAELIQIGEQMLINVKKPVRVKHEEHNEQLLEPGIWEIGRVREFDHFQQAERTVMD